MSSSESPPPFVEKTPLPAPPPRAPSRVPSRVSEKKGSRYGTLFVLLAIALAAIPVSARVKNAMAKKKSMEEDRTKTQQESVAKANAPLSVKVVKGSPTTWSAAIPFDGTLQPIHEAMLAFKATGPISQLKVKVGDYVKQGSLLAALDATEAYAQSRAASAQIKASQAQLALAKDHAERTAAMVKSGAAAGVQETQAQGQLDLTAAQLEGAQAQLALAGAMVKNHTLTAPFAGWVTMAPSSVGGLAIAGQPLFQMKDVSRLRLVGTVSEQDAPLVKLGSEVTITVTHASSSKTLVAKVTALVPSVDPATRRIPVAAEVDNDKDPILAGTFVHAQIGGGAALPVLKLPATALRPGSQDEVMVVEKGVLRAAKIVFARSTDGSLLVRSGIGADDEVLVTPPPEAKTGDNVEISQD